MGQPIRVTKGVSNDRTCLFFSPSPGVTHGIPKKWDLVCICLTSFVALIYPHTPPFSRKASNGSLADDMLICKFLNWRATALPHAVLDMHKQNKADMI